MPSITGRLANLMSRRLPAVGRAGTRRQLRQFRASDGRKGNRVMGKPIFVLDVVGRTSGEPRPVMLMHVPRGDDLIVIGSNAGNPDTPNWYRNLMAAGVGDVQVGADRWPVTARNSRTAPSERSAGHWRRLPTPTSPPTRNSPTAGSRSPCSSAHRPDRATSRIRSNRNLAT